MCKHKPDIFYRLCEDFDELDSYLKNVHNINDIYNMCNRFDCNYVCFYIATNGTLRNLLNKLRNRRNVIID